MSRLQRVLGRIVMKDPYSRIASVLGRFTRPVRIEAKCPKCGFKYATVDYTQGGHLADCSNCKWVFEVAIT